jgi:hypothetical protein
VAEPPRGCRNRLGHRARRLLRQQGPGRHTARASRVRLLGVRRRTVEFGPVRGFPQVLSGRLHGRFHGGASVSGDGAERALRPLGRCVS